MHSIMRGFLLLGELMISGVPLYSKEMKVKKKAKSCIAIQLSFVWETYCSESYSALQQAISYNLLEYFY